MLSARRVRRVLVALGVVLVAIQLVPYGRAHSDPPVRVEPAWSGVQARQLAVRGCFDCHSNQTTWPWYSAVAPVSWLVQRDVDGGRSQFNFSEWDKPQDVSVGDLTEVIRGGSMPPWYYAIPHRGANLTNAEQDALIRGLVATLRRSPPLGGGGG